jgi:hypothetical protein
MRLALRPALSCAALGLAVVWMLLQVSSAGDWPADSQPAVEALLHGHVGHYLSAKAMMGPFSTLTQVPFVALGGGGLDRYRWACVPGLLAVAALGLYLAAIARRRGVSRLGQGLIALFCLLNPLTFEALQNGHPEELLTAALAVGALATAAEGHVRRTALLLGLALGSKQWAVMAVLPVLLVLPKQRARVAIGAAVIAAALMLPSAIAAPGSVLGVQQQAASTGQRVTPWSVWYPAASTRATVYVVGDEKLEAEVEEAPALVGSLSHPLIVLLVFTLPLVLARRRGLPLSPADGFALFALLALLRCALDPVDNLYYHEPLLLALIGWEAFESRGLPLRGLAAVAVAALLYESWHHLSDPATFNLAYLAVVALLGAWLASSLFAAPAWTRVPVSAVFAGRNPNFRD